MERPNTTNITDYAGLTSEVLRELKNLELPIEFKGKFGYVAWAVAWDVLTDAFPHAYTRTSTADDGGFVFWANNGQEGFVVLFIYLFPGHKGHEVVYPVLDYNNKPVPKDKCNSFIVNTSIKRALAKGVSEVCGAGLHLYQGEDLPPDAKRREENKDPLEDFMKKLEDKYPDEQKRREKAEQICRSVGAEDIDALRNLPPAAIARLASLVR